MENSWGHSQPEQWSSGAMESLLIVNIDWSQGHKKPQLPEPHPASARGLSYLTLHLITFLIIRDITVWINHHIIIIIISSDCGGDHASDAHCWIIKNIISKIFFIDFKLIFPGSLFSISLIETDLHLNINWKLSTFKISTSNCWFPANRSPLHQNIHQKYCFLDCQKR